LKGWRPSPSLPTFRTERIEEHVLFCRDRQERLRAEINFTAAMKAAARKFSRARPGPKSDAAH
jgi:hypothetical protein